jgi:hypothetical protein
MASVSLGSEVPLTVRFAVLAALDVCWPVSAGRDRQNSTLGGRLNSCAKQPQQPFHESEVLSVQHAGSALPVVFFSL